MQPISLRERIKEILWSLCDTEEHLEFYVDKILTAMRESFDQDLNRLEGALSSYHFCQGEDITK